MQVLARPRDLQLPDTARPDTQEGVITRLHVVGHEARVEVRGEARSRGGRPALEGGGGPARRAAGARRGRAHGDFSSRPKWRGATAQRRPSSTCPDRVSPFSS